MATEVWAESKKLVVIHFYNPCRKLELNRLEEIEGISKGSIVWCGDFNAHNTLWGSDKTNYSDHVVEELLNKKHLVCINDGRNTRLYVNTGKESVLDLTIVTSTLVPMCDWHVYQINVATIQTTERIGGKWIFGKANWENVMIESDKHLHQISDNMNTEIINSKIRQGIILAAACSIPKTTGRMKKKRVPWWDDKCKQAIKSRKKAFKLVKRSHNFQHLVQYKQAQAMVRKTRQKGHIGGSSVGQLGTPLR